MKHRFDDWTGTSLGPSSSSSSADPMTVDVTVEYVAGEVIPLPHSLSLEEESLQKQVPPSSSLMFGLHHHVDGDGE